MISVILGWDMDLGVGNCGLVPFHEYLNPDDAQPLKVLPGSRI